jgi:hypothetical protein
MTGSAKMTGPIVCLLVILFAVLMFSSTVRASDMEAFTLGDLEAAQQASDMGCNILQKAEWSDKQIKRCCEKNGICPPQASMLYPENPLNGGDAALKKSAKRLCPALAKGIKSRTVFSSDTIRKMCSERSSNNDCADALGEVPELRRYYSFACAMLNGDLEEVIDDKDSDCLVQGKCDDEPTSDTSGWPGCGKKHACGWNAGKAPRHEDYRRDDWRNSLGPDNEDGTYSRYNRHGRDRGEQNNSGRYDDSDSSSDEYESSQRESYNRRHKQRGERHRQASDDKYNYHSDWVKNKRNNRRRSKDRHGGNGMRGPIPSDMILKSQIIPPVCPRCPVSCPKTGKSRPCPPCGRCPEPSFSCQKVPNYTSGNQLLPDAGPWGSGGSGGRGGGRNPVPRLNSFSSF